MIDSREIVRVIITVPHAIGFPVEEDIRVESSLCMKDRIVRMFFKICLSMEMVEKKRTQKEQNNRNQMNTCVHVNPPGASVVFLLVL
jgi:hypothetical protein